MSQHYNQAATQMIDSVFDASQVFVVNYISRDATYKQIAQTLIKNDLGRHTRIGATDDDGKRMLGVCQFRAPLCCLTGMLQIAARVTTVAFFQLGDCLRGSYRGLVRMGWISCTGKLA